MLFRSERDKSYIYDILKYSQEVIDIVKDENHNSFVNNRIKRLAMELVTKLPACKFLVKNDLSDDNIRTAKLNRQAGQTR